MRIALIAVLVAVSAPAFATDTGSKAPSVDGAVTQAATEAPKTENPAEKKICRRIDASESRMAAKRLCLTEEQWKRRDQESSDL